MYKFSLLIALLFCVFKAQSQDKINNRYQERFFQISVVPGLGLNGMHSAWYLNKFSLNIFSGYSAANRYFQLSGISSTATQYATGIQIAGIANVVGSNSFINLSLGEERKQMREGFKSNMTGIQFAGIINLVRNDMSGIQLTGAINFVHGSNRGFQLAGISNMVGEDHVGMQIAGLYNVALRNSTGTQISLLSNLTNGAMYGLQLSLFNKAWRINGKQSDPPSKVTGWQIGLVNLASKMNGVQIGLINRARQMRGTQIGLINFFSTAPNKKHGNNGTPIGLINIGNKGAHNRLYSTETFIYNFELTTGNCFNCTKTRSEMPLNNKFKIMNQNALIIAYNSPVFKGANDPEWAIGYGFEKVHYNKNSMGEADMKNERYFFSYGLKLLHLNYEKKIENALSLLTTLDLEFGYKIRNKIMTFYLFGGVSANGYFNNSKRAPEPETLVLESNSQMSFWPGYEFGIHLY